jgi:hypothetical protein
VREHVFTAAAWAPWMDLDILEARDRDAVEGEKDWVRRRDGLATRWVEANRGRAGLVLRLPSHARQHREGTGPLAGFAARATIITNRGSASAHGATLVPEGYAREIAGAWMRLTARVSPSLSIRRSH